MRAVIYARYSTDRQSEMSIDDQETVCRARADREGWTVTAVRSDQAISGSTAVAARPGGALLLADAMAGRMDVLIVEGLDRLSRDQVEQESVVRRLEHRGLRIIGVADGYDSSHAARKVMRGVRGLINELFLDDLRHKTHRGQSGQVARGYVAGGKSYGYRIVRGEGGSQYEIDDEEARWVRWIFERYASGHSAGGIAHELNRLGVPSPRGSTWAKSAVYGSPIKGSGVLNNTLYVGRYVWNRSQWVKDPDTGRRQRVERPRAEWQEMDCPELRIVPESVWRAVRGRMDEGRDEFGRKRGQRPASTLLGGLMRCPYCGGAVVAINGLQYGCGVAKDRGPTVCRGWSIRRDLAERRLLSLVRDDLLSPQAAMAFEAAFREMIQAEAEQDQESPVRAQQRLAALEQEIGRLVNGIAAVGASPALTARLRAAEAEAAELRRAKGEAVDLEFSAAEVRAIFHRALMDLEGSLKAGDPMAARQALGQRAGHHRYRAGGRRSLGPNTNEPVAFEGDRLG